MSTPKCPVCSSRHPELALENFELRGYKRGLEEGLRGCPPWVKRAMERIHDMVAPSVLSGEYGRLIVKVFMDEAAKDGVAIS